MDTITASQEQRVESTIYDALNHIKAGSTPNEALFKAASDKSLEPEFVKRASQILNSVLHLGHYKKASSASERKNEFDLSDADIVLSKLYPDFKQEAVKEAHAIAEAGFLREYDRAESFDFNTPVALKPELPQIKKASAPVNFEAVSLKIANYRGSLSHAISEASLTKTALEREVYGLINKVSDYFVTHGHIPFERVESAMTYGAEKQAAVSKIFDLIYSNINGAARREKRAAACDKFIAYDQKSEPFVSLESLYNACERLANINEQIKTAKQELDEFNGDITGKILDIMEARGDLSKSAAPAGPRLLSDLFNKVITQPTGSYLKAHTGMTLKSDKPTDPASKFEDRVNRTIGDVINPERRTEEATADAELMLHDFMLNDDVISGYDPSEVAQAFNEISTLAPRAVRQPIIVRGLLRRYLQQGHLEGIESSQATGLESNLLNLETPPRLPGPIGATQDKK